MSVIKKAGLALCLMLSIGLSVAQEANELSENVAELRNLANRAHAQGDQETFRSVVARLHELRPNNSEYMYQLVLAHAVLGELTEAFNIMLSMQRQGLSYDFDKSPDSMNLREKKVYSYLNDLMIRAGQPMGEATEVATLDAGIGQVEAIDWDPGREAFLVATITDGRLLAVRRDGSFTELLRADRENGLWGIYDLAVDIDRNRLWLTSSATPSFAGFDPVDKGLSALYELELDTLKVVNRYPVPVDGLPHNLGSMSLATTGDLFFADRSLPILYVLKSGEDRLRPVFATRKLVNLRGIAVSADGSQIYVSDYEMGIIRVDLETGQISTLAKAETLNLGGIDGLEYVDGALLIIQNGIQPQRIMRLTLDVTGTMVAEVAPVAVALEVFDKPNYGTVVGDELVFFANSFGRNNGQETDRPLKIVSANLAGVQNIVPPDMQKFLDDQARRRMQRPGLEEAGAGDSTGQGTADDSNVDEDDGG